MNAWPTARPVGRTRRNTRGAVWPHPPAFTSAQVSQLYYCHKKQQDVREKTLVSEAEAAQTCGMTRAAIHDLVRRGRFRSPEVEARGLASVEEVEAFAREPAGRGRRCLQAGTFFPFGHHPDLL